MFPDIFTFSPKIDIIEPICTNYKISNIILYVADAIKNTINIFLKGKLLEEKNDKDLCCCRYTFAMNENSQI